MNDHRPSRLSDPGATAFGSLSPRTPLSDPGATASGSMSPRTPVVDVVVPTVGRESLGRLLDALAAAAGPPPG